MEIYSDWPLAYINWTLFCIIYWLLIGIAIMGKRYMHRRHQLHRLQDLIAYRERQQRGGDVQ